MNDDKKFKISMLFLRSTVFLVMLMWTLDKFINPAHAAKVYEKFYFIPGLDNLMITVIGAAELVLLLLFFFGFKKKFTYGAVLALHAVSTLSSFGQYLSPFEGPNLLFFAAWPMLAACVMLCLFREKDSLLQLGPKFA
jgi:putative oxidoreductase